MRGKSEKETGGERPICREILRRLCADAGKRPDSPFCREISRHLERCEKCRAQAISLRGTVALYRCLGGEDVPDAVTRKLEASLGLGTDASPA